MILLARMADMLVTVASLSGARPGMPLLLMGWLSYMELNLR